MEKLDHVFNKMFFLLIFISVSSFALINCKKDVKKEITRPMIVISDDEIILSQIINPLLDSNRFFFTNDFSFPPPKKPSIDFKLVISDTLNSVNDCNHPIVIAINNLRIDTTRYVLTNRKECEKLHDCVFVQLTRICFINDNSAFFLVKFIRNGDFSRESKVFLLKKDGNWVIDKIDTILVS